MLKKPTIWAEIGEIDGFIAIFYSSKMKWKSNFSKSLNSSNQPWFIWIVFWILHSKRLQKICILQNCQKNHEPHTLNMLWGGSRIINTASNYVVCWILLNVLCLIFYVGESWNFNLVKKRKIIHMVFFLILKQCHIW